MGVGTRTGSLGINDWMNGFARLCERVGCEKYIYYHTQKGVH